MGSDTIPTFYTAVYDHATVHSIVDACPVLHVSFVPTDDDPFPTILPMIGCTGEFPGHGTPDGSKSAPSIYLHGYVSSRLMRSGNSNGGIPICIAATHVDGIVLALTPHDHSNNYRSAVVHGYAYIVTDDAERMYALQAITESVVPQRWDNSRVPPTQTELTSTGLLRVEIVTASAKIRAGQPHSNRHDLADEQLVGRVWTGVISSYVQYGEPVPDDTNGVAKVPEYLRTWVDKENSKNRDAAREAMEENGVLPKALMTKSFFRWS
jgi:nitroimidazol reductase NimA-like FMN-containing flavoprotein (pyridoxamine 5'-phosphate oxidase superfamily)